MKNWLLLAIALVFLTPANAYSAQGSTFIQGPTLIESADSFVTSGGTTTLTSSSYTFNRFTGTSSHTVRLPSALTLKQGRKFIINNRSTQSILVEDNTGAPLRTVPSNFTLNLIVQGNASAAGDWDHGSPSGSEYADGGIVFGKGSGANASTDTSNLFWDDSLNRLGIGTNGPSSTLHVVGSARITGLSTAGPVITDASGNLSSEQYLDLVRGGTGQDNTNITFPSTGVIVTEDGIHVLTNKDIDADSNTITNIADANIKTGANIARAKLASGSIDHVVINDGSGVLSSEAQLAVSRGGTGTGTTPTNGQLLIGNGTNYSLSTITGTSNQVSVTNGAGSITLGAPQDIGTGSDVQFLSATLTNGFGVGQNDVNGTATQNALATTLPFVKLTSGGTPVTTINGATAPTTPSLKFIWIYNDTGSDVTVAHENASATASNRFKLPGGTVLTISTGSTATFFYDASASRWVVAAGSGSGTGGSGGLSSVMFNPNFQDGPNFPTYTVSGTTIKWSYYSIMSTSELYFNIIVPKDYVAGTQIKIRAAWFSDTNMGDVLLRTKSELRDFSAPTVVDSEGTLRTSTNTTVSLLGATIFELRKIDFDITDSSGQISGSDVGPGDVIRIKIYRDTDDALDTIQLLDLPMEMIFGA
jgi:hypothetical protein